VQYRKVGSAESLWIVNTAGTPSSTPLTVSPQWAQIDVTGGTVATTPVQQQIFSPDTTLNRWMGSIAADKDGNVALGYSTSNGTAPNYPSIAYAGRLVTDPLDTLPQTEVQLVAGAGSQDNSCGGGPCNRWGDYTAMTVDPVDDCTFWYTNEYYSSAANGTSGNWQTRIGSFKFPTCGATSTTGYLRVTSSPALPTQVSVDGTIADSWGLNWVEVAPGSHTICFSHVSGYTDPACATVSVTAGATTTVTGTFTQRGTLRVLTSPAVAGTISVDGTPRNAWGMWTDLPVGLHSVCFGPVAGYTAPACQNTTLTAGATNTVTGTYTVSP
jgi:hypothetical protein